MTQELSIILRESDSGVIRDIAAILKEVGDSLGKPSVAADFQDVLGLIRNGYPHIVFLDVTDVEQGVRETTALVSQFPQVTVIVTAAEKNPDWILRLIRAGAGEYLTKPIIGTELAAAIRKVSRLYTLQNESINKKGTVISVYNPSGGMGTTTIAVNLAASLAALGGDVVLVDLNLFCSDVTAFLDLSPRYTLSSITSRLGQVDASFLKSVIVSHLSGFHVLCGPVDLAEADRIQPEQLRDVIAVLQGLFTHTVIDTGGQLYGCNQATFECSDKILFVTHLSLPALKNAKRYLAAMNNEGFGPDRVKLIINRYISKDEIKVSDAEKVFNTKAYLTVPNAYSDTKTAINKGVPLMACNPRSPVTKAMDDLARQLNLETTGRIAAI